MAEETKKALLKADFDNILASWGKALHAPKSAMARDSAILRFELTYEVTWKLLQLVLEEQGFQVKSPRQSFQQAFSMGWFPDEEIWVDIMKARNTAVHVYREAYAEALYNQLHDYYQTFQELQTVLNKEVDF